MTTPEQRELWLLGKMQSLHGKLAHDADIASSIIDPDCLRKGSRFESSTEVSQ
jgi:hypothetical protein